MKRFCACLCLLLSLMLCACGAGGQEVEILMPKDFLIAALTVEAKEDGKEPYISRTENSDGSVSYVMTETQRKAALARVAAFLDTENKTLIGGESTPNITAVTANANYSVFTVTTTSEEVDFAESMCTLRFFIYGGAYAALEGDPERDIRADYINAATGAVIYSESLNDAAETTTAETTAPPETQESAAEETTAAPNPGEKTVVHGFDPEKNQHVTFGHLDLSLPSYWSEDQSKQTDSLRQFSAVGDQKTIALLAVEHFTATAESFAEKKDSVLEKTVNNIKLNNCKTGTPGDITAGNMPGRMLTFTGDLENGTLCSGSVTTLFSGESGEAMLLTLLLDDTASYDLSEDYARTVDSIVTVQPAIELTGYRLAKDYSGNNVLVAEFTLTNHTSSEQSFLSTYSASAYQNKVECNSAILVEGIDSADKMKGIQPGGTLKVECGFVIKDSSDVTVQVKELFGSKTYLTQTIPLK